VPGARKMKKMATPSKQDDGRDDGQAADSFAVKAAIGEAENRTGPRPDNGGSPYSPSQSVEAMEVDGGWASNLDGVKNLFSTSEQPPATTTPPAEAAGPPNEGDGGMPPPIHSTRKEKAKKSDAEAGGATATETTAAEGEERTAATTPPAAAAAQTQSTTATATVGASMSDQPREEDIAEKCRQFIMKAKEKTTEEIRNRMGRELLTYEAISSRNKKSRIAINILGTSPAPTPAPEVTGWISLGDGRFLSGGLNMALNTWKIISTSFDADWTCLRCGSHGSRPAFKIRGEADSSCSIQVIVLSDQAFPAVIPAASVENCIKILLIENAKLDDLVEEFCKLVGNRRVPPGTLLLLFSASHLADVGTAAYAEDYLEAEKKIKSKFGNLTRVGPLPPLLLDGTNSKQMIRSIFEIENWFTIYYHGDLVFLEDSHVAAQEMLIRLGEGKQSLEPWRIRLPGKDGKKVYSSGGEDSRAVPCNIKPLTHLNEKELITGMIRELRSKLALDLDPNPSFERGLGIQSRAKVRCNYLIVGSSNATRLRQAMESMGHSSCIVHLANWRIGRGCTEGLISMVKEAMKSSEPDTIVLQLLDSSCFYAKGPDGSRQLATRGPDGRFHMEGEVRVCSREVQLDHFDALKPLLDIFERRRVLIVTPMPRYIVAGCCNEAEHCSNRGERGYRTSMLQGLEDIRYNLKEYLFHKGKRQVRVLDPNIDIRGMTDSEVWDTDPIHPRPEVYKKIAEAVLKMGDLVEDNKRRRSDSGASDSEQASRGRGGQAPSFNRGQTMWQPRPPRSRGGQYGGGRGHSGYRGRSLGRQY
jgi:hypothetical protein